MADVFISYSKEHAQLTIDLARDLEAEGYTTWWDTSLFAGDVFPKEIGSQLDAAKAVIVIWSESAVRSDWVLAEAQWAKRQKKLITVRSPTLDPKLIPLPFNAMHAELVTDRARIFSALNRILTPPRMKALEGTWTGQAQQHEGLDGQPLLLPGHAIFTFLGRDKFLGTRYTAKLHYEHDTKTFNLEAAEVRQLDNHHVILHYADEDGTVLRYGTILLHLSGDGRRLDGKFLAYGAEMQKYVDGVVSLTKLD
jgi:hypothetical protein